MQDLIYLCLKNLFFGHKLKKKTMTSTVLDFLLGSIEAFHAALQVTVIMQTWRSKTLNVSWLELWLVLQHFFLKFLSLLPVATLVTTNKPCLPPRLLMSHMSCAHENPNECRDNSLGFVHDTEGERKASSNFLKLSLRNEAVLVMIVVLKHRLRETRGHKHVLLLWYLVSKRLQEKRRVFSRLKESNAR